MKLFLLFIIVSFAGVNISHATTVSSRKSTTIKKTVVSTSVATGKKNVKASKKKTPVAHCYKVRSGDSLYSIARRNGMKLVDLQRLNGLKKSFLKPGQILLVSGKMKKNTKTQAHEIVSESRKVILQIAIPNDDGLFTDSLSDVGVEPIARTYLSTPYRYGAKSRKSTDCSGFVQQVFREFDIQLPRTAREQYSVGKKVERASLASGDLLFFRTRASKSYPTHVGIYLGNGKMIHASSRQHQVVISDVNHPYYVNRYVGAKRSAISLSAGVDFEMLARQMTEDEADAPRVTDESMLTRLGIDGSVLDVGDDEQGEEGLKDDIDTEIEPDADPIVPASPRLGLLFPSPQAAVDGVVS